MTAMSSARNPAVADAKPFRLTRSFNAPRDVVFRAFTDLDQLNQWWGPKGLEMMHATLDLRPGGMFHYGMKSPEGAVMWGKWIYREISPPDRLVYVVSFSDEQGGVTRHPMASSWPREMLSTTVFTEENGRTVMTSETVPLNASAEESATFDQGHDGMQQGFTGTLDRLEAHLATVCAPPPVVPYLTVKGAAEAIAWYGKAFGAVEHMRLPAEDGKRLMHAAIGINGGTVFLSDEFVEFDGGSAPKEGQIPPVAMALNLASPAELDATFRRAVDAGATGLTEPRDEFWGARFAVLADPFGHRWMLNSMLKG